MLSGGLDSILAVLLLRRQNIDVTAVTFLTHFGCDVSDTSSCSRDSSDIANIFGFDVKLHHLADKFIEIVKKPKFGHGKNMNPCIDCRILMLREAKELMEIIGADFIVTGEVLGQRPMSQRRDTFPVIDREAGLKGLVLRPLCAKLMKPTIPEENGMVNRELLMDFNGRSRKPQIALAHEFGLKDKDIPNAAGGCLLTEPGFSYRLALLLRDNPNPSMRDYHLLKIGRHFKLSSGLRAIVGRDEKENDKLEAFAEKDEYLFWVEDIGSPRTLLIGAPSQEEIMQTAAITARYSDAGKELVATVSVRKGDEVFDVTVQPMRGAELDELRIEYKGKKVKALQA